jgi:hypothetical protein
MLMNKKAFSILLSVLFLISVFTFGTYAEDTEVVTDSIETTVDTTPSAYSEFVAKVEAYASTGYSNSIVYTSDSVKSKGVTLEPYTDTVKFETGFVIKTDLDLGIEIYDDPTTDVIEGVRVNGQEITSYIVPIDLDTPQDYLVEVRLVYADGLTGTIAKISDGNFDWETLMQEPLLAMQVFYYAIAALSIIIGGMGALSSKKKKVKTADDIAAKVDARVQEGCETFAVAYSAVLKENLLPVFHTMVDTNKAVVKAIALSTSKNKEAPVALLDLLKDVSDVDVEKAIDNAREEVIKNIANTDAKRAAVRDVLSHIADGTYQEVHRVKEPKPISESESEPKASETVTEADKTKSVF